MHQLCCQLTRIGHVNVRVSAVRNQTITERQHALGHIGVQIQAGDDGHIRPHQGAQAAQQLAFAVVGVFGHGYTYSAHPLACAAAVASINIFKEEKIVEHARMLGKDVIGPALEKLKAKHPSVGDVRGLGVFWAIELVKNRDTRKPLVPYNAAGADAKPMAVQGTG